MMSFRNLAVSALLVLSSLPVRAQKPPAVEETDEGCPEQRIHEYLERHGDYGRIDPEVMLELSRQTKVAMDARRFVASTIGGSAWKSLGPTNGAGRATALAIHPTIAGTAIIGAAGGGAWTTSDGGATWRPLTDDVPNLSVGALAYSLSDPKIVYLGTGEGGYAGDFIPGIGLLMSSDGGETWTLPSSVVATQFYRLLVGPADPQDVFAATNNGLLHSTRGQNGPWTQVINSTPHDGIPGYGDVTDLVRDPSAPKTLYATTWDRRFWCAKSQTACAADTNLETPGVMKSIDGGATWVMASVGLPVSTKAQRVNRMAIAIAPSSPQTLYVATSILDGGTGNELSHVYRSTDGAATWTETSVPATVPSAANNYLTTQAWYGNAIVVSPTDPDTVFAGGVTYVRTNDGGVTWTRVLSDVHVDVHDLRYDGQGVLWIANDGGIWSATDNGTKAIDRNKGLVTRQFYAIANDPANRNRIYGGQQDNGTVYRSDGGGSSWTNFSGGDGFACAVVPTAPSIAYSTVQNGVVLRTMTAGSLYRVADRTPLYAHDEVRPFYSIVMVDPNSPSTVYAASYRVWKSTTGGDGWLPLSTNVTGGGSWPADVTIRAMAIAPQDSKVIMVSTSSPRRRILRTTDGGASWTDVTANMPAGRTVLHLDIDPRDGQHVMAALAGTSSPSIYQTTNGGVSWQPRGTGLPAFSAQTVRFDPNHPGTIYAGTDVGVYRTTDSGANWQRFGAGMPAVSVYDIDPSGDGSLLRAATHGRGVWELDVSDRANLPPVVSIGLPSSQAISVTKGSTVSFNGVVDDMDDGIASATWTFSDTWSAIPAQTGVIVKHRFDRPGRFPIGLSATDTHGSVGADTIEVDVLDPADSCGTPSDIPGNGPFPYSVTLNTDFATNDSGDPATQMTCYPYEPQSSTWLTFTAQTAGYYQFSLCGSEASAVLIGYTGDECGAFTTSTLCITRPSADTECDSPSSTQSVLLRAGYTMRMFVTNYFANDFGNVTVTVTQNFELSPIVTSVSPAVGAAGTPIVINGTGFQPQATVQINGADAKNVVVVSPSQISATVNATGTSPANVTVVNPDGSVGTLKEGFSFDVAAPGPKRRGIGRH